MKFFQRVICAVLFTITAKLYANELEVNNQTASVGTGEIYFIGPRGAKGTVTYEDKGGYQLIEGDIRVPINAGFSADPLSSVIIDGFRWGNSTLPYKFSNVSANVKSMVRQAAAHINQRTNALLVEVTAENASLYPYYVRVVDDAYACWSYVGESSIYFGNYQDLNVVPECGFGSTVHEFLHALGMFHEQSREDRDSFVNINFLNIQSGKEGNFQKQIEGASDLGNYDYGSIMHYGRYAFSVSSGVLPTITPLQSGVTIGQRDGLSSKDINAVNAIYASAPRSNKGVTIIPQIMLLLE